MITDEYRAQLELAHAQDARWGTSAHKYAGEVAEYAKSLGAKTILDYGCGKGVFATSLAGGPFTIKEYDPGIPAKASLPDQPCDVVVSLDVLEHIEPCCLGACLDEIKSTARQGAFLVIALYAVNRTLPDGRGVHLIVESEEWWEARLRHHFAGWTLAKLPTHLGRTIIDHTGRERPKKPSYKVTLTAPL